MSINYSGDSLLGMFLFETTQLLEQLEENILNSENKAKYTQDDINEIFRIMHTIKGSAAMMQFNNISKLAHSLEDLFDFLRDGESANIDYSALSDLVFENVDFINDQVGRIEAGATEDEDASDLINSNREYLNFINNGDLSENIKDNDATDTQDEKRGNKEYTYLYKAVIHFSEGCKMENIRAFAVINNLDEIAGEIHHNPEELMEPEASEIIKEDGFEFIFKSDYSYVDVHQLLIQTVFLKELELEQVENVAHEPIIYKDTSKSQSQTQRPAVQHQSIVSVPVDKLDQLMDIMGEFVIAEAMVTQNPDLEGLELNNFEKAARQLNKITNELQDIVMSIRMVPLSATFNKMKRLVRDMKKSLDKEVNLAILGEETEVDKNIIEHISDPLMHLVRNALDHGLESIEERKKAGKKAVGNITLEAKNAGSDVLIIVKDDGKGIKKENIIAKAKERGLLKRPEDTMSDKEIYNLILLPGFSTKANVTEYSGRGVGMDVVTKSIEAIGGSVSIDSRVNEGTTFTMKLPLTLAIVDGMNIRVGKSIYTIPTINIREFFEPVLSDVIIDPGKNEMVMVRGECYPILRLHKIFEVETRKTNFQDGIFIMIQQDDNKICLFVDELIGQQQIVVKALPEYISKGKNVKGLTGCTLLGDGSISLILDVIGLNDLL